MYRELFPSDIDEDQTESLRAELFQLVQAITLRKFWNPKTIKILKGISEFPLLEGRHELSQDFGHLRLYFVAHPPSGTIFGLHLHLKDLSSGTNDAIRIAQNVEISKAEDVWRDFLENNPEFI